MARSSTTPHFPRAQILTEKAFSAVERFMHIEATSGIVLLLAAVTALIWANLPGSHSYHDFWHLPLSLSIGSWSVSHSLHFWINDALMTVFFLVVGMEIRREIYEGALSDKRFAILPVMAAIGGVVVPALIYVAFNLSPELIHGWAVPTATDIAFAVGVLALLGKSIPGNVRIFLLALAIIDDIAAVLIIAIFYSGGLDYSGFAIAAVGIAMIVLMHQMGIGSAYAYVVPAAVLWIGFLQTGAHPTLAGVVLGLMTPVLPARTRHAPLDMAAAAVDELVSVKSAQSAAAEDYAEPLRKLRLAQREMLAPVTRVQMALHPWVAFGVMPIFALANAGVSLDGVDLSVSDAQRVMAGTIVALVLGKPLGIILFSWLAVKCNICTLPQGVNWLGVSAVGMLAGIGFTMSIFIAMLAFNDAELLAAAKLGVLTASLIAGIAGLFMGWLLLRSVRKVQ